MRWRISTIGAALGLVAVPVAQASLSQHATQGVTDGRGLFTLSQGLIVAQAMVPPTGMGEADKAMAAANMAAEERMRRRFPQPVRVSDLIGLPVLDDSSRTLGFVQQVLRTPNDKIELIVSYGGWFGWGSRSVAVPIEVVGILGRQLASLDMTRNEFAAAPTWQGTDTKSVPNDETILVALARR